MTTTDSGKAAGFKFADVVVDSAAHRVVVGSTQRALEPRAFRLLEFLIEQREHVASREEINLSQVFAGQTVGVKQTDDHIWLVTFMDYDLGYFDDETCRLEPIADPFGPRLLPMSPE